MRALLKAGRSFSGRGGSVVENSVSENCRNIWTCNYKPSRHTVSLH